MKGYEAPLNLIKANKPVTAATIRKIQADKTDGELKVLQVFQKHNY